MWVIEDDQYLGEQNGWSRAEQFGDGVFETLKIKGGEILAKNLHIQRMKKGLAVLNIALPKQGLDAVFESAKNKLLSESKLQNGTLKIMAARENSHRGYGYEHNGARFTYLFSPESLLPKQYYDDGIDVQVCATQCSIHAQLAGLKHLNRLENVLAKAELEQGAFEGLMLNAHGYVIEGVMSNVFFEKDGQLITPDLSCSGVQGVMRSLILNYCHKHKITVSVRDIKSEELEAFDHGFMCNSIMGVVPIKSIKNKIYNKSPLIMQLLEAWSTGVIYE